MPQELIIFIFVKNIFVNGGIITKFMKILYRENLELYGTYSMLPLIVQECWCSFYCSSYNFIYSSCTQEQEMQHSSVQEGLRMHLRESILGEHALGPL